MKHLAAIFLILAAAAAHGQTVKSLGYNTTNGQVIYSGTNALYFTNPAVGFAKPPIFKVLTNDFSITNQTNFVTVDGLTLPTEAGKHYVVKLFPSLRHTQLASDVIIAASNNAVFGNWDSFGTSGFTTNPLTNAQTFGHASDTTRVFVQNFYVASGTNDGSISFQFRSTVETNVNTIHAGSYILAQEVNPQ